MKRIALYGGTFDPVHLGHLKIANTISQLFEIDQLFFLPAYRAPHKLTRETSSSFHRYAMLTLATADEPGLLVSAYELESSATRYTVDTLGYFKAAFADRAALFFIMGADSWSEISTWREWEKVLGLTNHIVVTRPGFDIELTKSTVAARVVDLRGNEATTLTVPGAAANDTKIFVTDAVMHDISATQIRSIAQTEPARLTEFVPQVVANYIQKYQLYRNLHEE